MRFEILHRSSRSQARVGRIHTPHGVIDTPNFVAVGTHASIKSLDSQAVDAIGLQLIFCNTYHLLLQPGPDIIQESGGLHRFMRRSQPIITDSGGFQIFSLAYGSIHQELKSQGKKMGTGSVLKVSEEGVLFRSYRDGSSLLLTPESSVTTQKALGADIIIPLDELLPYHASSDRLKASLERTHRWEERSLLHHLKKPKQQGILGVIHGGLSEDMRKLSCRTLTRLPFDGFAIGGSLGKNKEEMIPLVAFTRKQLPPEAPIHLLGIADPPSFPHCIPLGIDTFDSAYPTKAARHGTLFTSQGNLNITRKVHAREQIPVAPNCPCATCTHYSRAYLHHLFKAHELTAYSLATIHNLTFMKEMMVNYRQQILHNTI
ncbi:MAG: tRNA guanosine(34) transglycosylase Tgt [Chlamydiota bacterium]|nr:tRNA guanosine(34) transglycosylase Tgt [Chlamydiota bacterium]